jgi:Nif-specific regulatory protein
MFQRVGGNKPLHVNIRIIAATNRDLQERVDAGTFRGDLFYRLNVMPLMIPPLRERGSDIVNLADHFVTRFAKENGKPVTRISAPALQMLMNYAWPGNVRELENVIERAVVLCEGEEICGYDLPPSLQEAALPPRDARRTGLEAKLETVEYEYIVEALKSTQGNMSDAAEQLGMTRRMLGLRMKKYRIEYRPFRGG